MTCIGVIGKYVLVIRVWVNKSGSFGHFCNRLLLFSPQKLPDLLSPKSVIINSSKFSRIDLLTEPNERRHTAVEIDGIPKTAVGNRGRKPR